jgi:L-ascorbate metabolism protein UlaG (beta-lactamase superfamily)
VAVIINKTLLVFDYYQDKPGGRMKDGAIHPDDIRRAERVYVFVSHSHHDHYNKLIFGWAAYNENVTYILDGTVPEEDRPDGAVVLGRAETFDDGHVFVQAFGSTDIGGSFYVRCGGQRIFHAGDLNYWHWKDEADETYTRAMDLSFGREMRLLSSRVEAIDYAFFPVDKRMGTDYDEGAVRFIDMMKPGVFIPIHFVDYHDTKAFKKKMRGNGAKVLRIRKNGQRLK